MDKEDIQYVFSLFLPFIPFDALSALNLTCEAFYLFLSAHHVEQWRTLAWARMPVCERAHAPRGMDWRRYYWELSWSIDSEPVRGAWGHSVDSFKVWMLRGRRHRLADQMAVIYVDEIPDKWLGLRDMEWRINGQRHRDNDMPAIIDEDGTCEWWVRNKHHRENGPAVIERGFHTWWTHNNFIRLEKIN